jgi:hypothetical protein
MEQTRQKGYIGLRSELREEVSAVVNTRRTLALVTALAVLALSALTGPKQVQSAQAPVESGSPAVTTQVASIR